MTKQPHLKKYIEFSIQNNRYLKKACGHAFTARLSEEQIAAESRLMKKISNGEKVMRCPRCGSSAVVKNGSIANGKKRNFDARNAHVNLLKILK